MLKGRKIYVTDDFVDSGKLEPGCHFGWVAGSQMTLAFYLYK